MANYLLDFIAKDGNFYFNNFGEALIYALIGFLIVFLGISLIILIIWLLGLLFKKTDNLAFLRNLGKKIKAKKNKQPQEEPAAFSETAEIPDDVKAAIIAAIMAYYSELAPNCEFKVKRIKRI